MEQRPPPAASGRRRELTPAEIASFESAMAELVCCLDEPPAPGTPADDRMTALRERMDRFSPLHRETPGNAERLRDLGARLEAFAAARRAQWPDQDHPWNPALFG